MTGREQLESVIESLGLKAMQSRLPNLLEQAAQQEPGYADFLCDTLKIEADARRSRYLRALTAGAPAVRKDLRSV